MNYDKEIFPIGCIDSEDVKLCYGEWELLGNALFFLPEEKKENIL